MGDTTTWQSPVTTVWSKATRRDSSSLAFVQLSSLSLFKQFAVPLMDHNGPLLCLDKEMKTKEEYLFDMRIVAVLIYMKTHKNMTLILTEFASITPSNRSLTKSSDIYVPQTGW